jgi:hypothetical protein
LNRLCNYFGLINHFIDPNEGSDGKKKKRRLEEKKHGYLAKLHTAHHWKVYHMNQ